MTQSGGGNLPDGRPLDTSRTTLDGLERELIALKESFVDFREQARRDGQEARALIISAAAGIERKMDEQARRLSALERWRTGLVYAGGVLSLILGWLGFRGR